MEANIAGGHLPVMRLAGMRTFAATLAIGLVPVAHGSAQQVNPVPVSFEIASIKPGDPNATTVRVAIRPGGRFVATNATVKMLIRQAFDLRDSQIYGGPKWLDSENYNIDAKASESVAIPPGPAGGALFRSMLRSLLVERFGLVFHREARSEPVYQLVVAKGGPKLKATEIPADGTRGLRQGKGRITGMAASMPRLASKLSEQLGRPVTDNTGLTGEYDFTVDYAPDSISPGVDGPNAADDPSRPSIFTALQEQLGLRLESTKDTVQVLVIDRAERPSPN